MLRDYPIYFDDTAIPWPSSWSMEYINNQTVSKTEAGTDVVDTVRWHKLSVKASFSSTSNWAQFFESYSVEPSFELKYYHELEGDYVIATVRMTDFRMKLKPHSEKVRVSNGIWEISFSLEQF